jgi:glycosyltransferase involved in cell wall biosynthesis
MYKEIDFIDLNNTYGGSHVFFISFIKAFDSEFHLKKFIRNKKLYKETCDERSMQLSSNKLILLLQLIKYLASLWFTRNKKIIILNDQYEVLLSVFFPRKHKIIGIRHSSFRISRDRKKIRLFIYLQASQFLYYKVFISKETQRDYLELNGKAPSLTINNYLDKKWFSARSLRFKESEIIKLAIVGRIDSFKGHLMLLKAVAGIKNIELHIIGDGPQKHFVEQFVIKEGCKNIFFYGWLNEPINVYKSMDILLHPSVIEGGFPYVLMEFMALGKPVIASNLPQISEFVRDGVQGYLCPANNIRTWSKCILLLVNNIKLRRKMGLNSKQMAKKHFGKENFVKSYQKILL